MLMSVLISMDITVMLREHLQLVTLIRKYFCLLKEQSSHSLKASSIVGKVTELVIFLMLFKNMLRALDME